jgi:hypothetical protein
MAKQKKQPRPKAETPKGFRDYFGAEVTERNRMLAQIAEVYDRYGFDPLETSAVETVEALGKFLPDVDRPNDGVFAFEDDGTWLALRYDMTAPLARVAAQFRNDLPSPYRRYTMGPVWRNEKPGPGPVPAVLPMRCRYGGVCVGRGGCRDLRDARRHAGGRGHPARGLHRAGEQPEGAERRSGGRGPVRATTRSTSGGSCSAPSTSSTSSGRRACAFCSARAGWTRAGISRMARD